MALHAPRAANAAIGGRVAWGMGELPHGVARLPPRPRGTRRDHGWCGAGASDSRNGSGGGSGGSSSRGSGGVGIDGTPHFSSLRAAVSGRERATLLHAIRAADRWADTPWAVPLAELGWSDHMVRALERLTREEATALAGGWQTPTLAALATVKPTTLA